jgi:hypothetical protein
MNNDFSIDGLIRYYEDMHIQRGWKSSEYSHEYHVVQMLKKLRDERDEARRRLCLEWMEHGPVRLSKEQIAMRYGWDCFKENTNG